MNLYQKKNLLEVVEEGPINSMVREHGIQSKKIYLMPTKDLREMYEQVKKEQGQEQTDSKSGYKLEY